MCLFVTVCILKPLGPCSTLSFTNSTPNRTRLLLNLELLPRSHPGFCKFSCPIGSMGLVSLRIHEYHKHQLNLGKYTIHESYGCWMVTGKFEYLQSPTNHLWWWMLVASLRFHHRIVSNSLIYNFVVLEKSLKHDLHYHLEHLVWNIFQFVTHGNPWWHMWTSYNISPWDLSPWKTENNFREHIFWNCSFPSTLKQIQVFVLWFFFPWGP